MACGSNSKFESEHYISHLNVCSPDSTTPKEDGINYTDENFQLLTSSTKIAQKIRSAEEQELWGVRLRMKSAQEFSVGVRLKLVKANQQLDQPSEEKLHGIDEKVVYPGFVNSDSAWIDWKFSNVANLKANVSYWIVLEPLETDQQNLSFVQWSYTDLKVANTEYSFYSEQLGTWAKFSRTASHQLILCKTE